MFLLTKMKKFFPTEELHCQSGYKRYQPIRRWATNFEMPWASMTNVACSPVRWNQTGLLYHRVLWGQGERTVEREHGNRRKAKVLVMAESSLSGKKFKKGRSAVRRGNPKMQVKPDLKSETITGIVGGPTETICGTDHGRFHILGQIDKHFGCHFRQRDCQGFPILVTHCHKQRNAKRMPSDVHHKIKDQYLQLYLNEFCYKFNRRYFGERLSDRLVMATITWTTDFRARTCRRTLCG